MKPTDEELMAYADGELSAGDAARIEAAIAADPSLAGTVARTRALRGTLREAFAPMLDEPVPPQLLALARGDASGTVPTATVHALPASARRRWALPEWAAIAAALVLGVAVSRLVLAPDSGPVQSRDGALLASGDLARSLESRLVMEADGDDVRLGLSFRSRDGHYCRGFEIGGDRRLAGLACRDAEGRWQIPVLAEAGPAETGQLRQAGTALPAAVLAEVDARIDGEPLDAAQERAARDRGWR